MAGGGGKVGKSGASPHYRSPDPFRVVQMASSIRETHTHTHTNYIFHQEGESPEQLRGFHPTNLDVQIDSLTSMLADMESSQQRRSERAVRKLGGREDKTVFLHVSPPPLDSLPGP